jgi:hypothetical protein
MYIRKKVNRSGKVSVQIIDKSSGKYSVIKTIGCSAEITLVEKFVSEAESWIKNKKGSQEIDFDNSYQQLESLLDGIETIENIGLELLLGKLFDEIGFNKIKDNIFRYLVLSRLSYPTSKLKTTDYLLKYHNISIDINGVYRYLDKLYNKQKELV